MSRLSTLFKKATPAPQDPTPVQLPTHGFDHPFHETDYFYGAGQPEGREHPRTIVELRMCALSSGIRERPEWWEKIKDKTIVKKWREEALQEATDVQHPEWSLTPAMVNYVFEELQGYAELRDSETGIEVGPAERIWKSDKLIPSSLREKLLAAVVPFETIPDSEKDYHPGSDGFVHDFVHPSLYSVVYGRTIGKKPGSETTAVLAASSSEDSDSKFGSRRYRYRSTNHKFTSNRFQWLPSDFSVDDNGKVTLASPYINNINPIKQKELHSVIPEILQCAIPIFERVLADLVRPIIPTRIATSGKGGRGGGGIAADCIWEKGVPHPASPDDRREYSENRDKWYEKQRYRAPDAKKRYDGDLGVMKNRVSLKGKTIQVFVKVANIILTPERPNYDGGTWHVEGMRNEKIVSSFIYYFDSENISESKLGFRRATTEPRGHERSDDKCLKVLYDMDGESALVQDIGDVVTKTHRCVAFPNLYQHRVRPFHLEDPTKPGHRKILVFFLVDPTQKITSATDVPPQQREWVTDAMQNASEGSPISKLPFELLKMISEENDVTMSYSEAKRYQQELINERKVSVEMNSQDYFGVVRRRMRTLTMVD